MTTFYTVYANGIKLELKIENRSTAFRLAASFQREGYSVHVLEQDSEGVICSWELEMGCWVCKF
jgi:hypothetical protein